MDRDLQGLHSGAADDQRFICLIHHKLDGTASPNGSGSISLARGEHQRPIRAVRGTGSAERSNQARCAPPGKPIWRIWDGSSIELEKSVKVGPQGRISLIKWYVLGHFVASLSSWFSKGVRGCGCKTGDVSPGAFRQAKRGRLLVKRGQSVVSGKWYVFASMIGHCLRLASREPTWSTVMGDSWRNTDARVILTPSPDILPASI